MSLACKIIFNNNQYGVFYSGQTVAGRIELNIKKEKKVRGISLTIFGCASVKWAENHNSELCDGKENYVHSLTYLAGSPTASSFVLAPETYNYEFACLLPEVCPSSFEGKYGHIRYTAKICLERPWKFNQTYTHAFTVVKPLDLNYEQPMIRVPSQAETDRAFWSCCCTSKPLFMTVSIPQSGYVPGQVIPTRVVVHNKSSVAVKEILFTLRKIVTYQSQTPNIRQKQEIRKVSQNRAGDVPGNMEVTYDCYLNVPSMPPTTTGTVCRIIQIEYDLKVDATISGLQSTPEIVHPLTIGTIPLFNEPKLPNVDSNLSLGTAPADIDVNGSNSEWYSATAPSLTPEPNDLAPPSYREAVFVAATRVDTDEEHTFQSRDFIPMYPVYKFPNVRASPVPIARQTSFKEI